MASFTVVGLALQVDHLLFNVPWCCTVGVFWGVVPKTFLPNLTRIYELRQFAPAAAATRDTITCVTRPMCHLAKRLLFLPA